MDRSCVLQKRMPWVNYLTCATLDAKSEKKKETWNKYEELSLGQKMFGAGSECAVLIFKMGYSRNQFRIVKKELNGGFSFLNY